jgi:hypothetical protein
MVRSTFRDVFGTEINAFVLLLGLPGRMLGWHLEMGQNLIRKRQGQPQTAPVNRGALSTHKRTMHMES